MRILSINKYILYINIILYIYICIAMITHTFRAKLCVYVLSSWPTSNPRSPSPKPARRCSLEKAGVMVKMVANMLERIHDQNQLSNEISISSVFSIHLL